MEKQKVVYVNQRKSRRVVSAINYNQYTVFDCTTEPQQGLIPYVLKENYDKLVSAAKAGDSELLGKVLIDLGEL